MSFFPHLLKSQYLIWVCSRTRYESITVTQDTRDIFWEYEPLFRWESPSIPYASTDDTITEENSELSSEYHEPTTENEVYFGVRCPPALIPLLCIIHISDILNAQPARQFAIRAVALSSDFSKLSPRDQIVLACEGSVKEWVRPAFLRLVRERRTLLELDADDAQLYGGDFILTLSVVRDYLAYLLHQLAFEPPPILSVPSCEHPQRSPILTWFLALFNCEVTASCQQRWKTLWHNIVVLGVLNPSASPTMYGLERELRTEATSRLCSGCMAWFELHSISDTYVPMQRSIEEVALRGGLRGLGFNVDENGVW